MVKLGSCKKREHKQFKSNGELGIGTWDGVRPPWITIVSQALYTLRKFVWETVKRPWLSASFHHFLYLSDKLGVFILACCKQIMWIDHCKEIQKMTFWSISPSSEQIKNGFEGLMLKTSGCELTLWTHLTKPNYLEILSPTQHQSFFRNLPLYLFVVGKILFQLNKMADYNLQNI